MVATCSIFMSYAGTPAFLPVISEMREPRNSRKALYFCVVIVMYSYTAFSLVVYRQYGAWMAVPLLGSAGATLKIIACAVGFVGLTVTGCIYLRVRAKYVIVRILRNSKHSQADTFVHWSVWLGYTVGLDAMAFILAQAIPIFDYLLFLIGTLCFARYCIRLARLAAGSRQQGMGTVSVVAANCFLDDCVHGSIGTILARRYQIRGVHPDSRSICR